MSDWVNVEWMTEGFGGFEDEGVGGNLKELLNINIK